MKQARTKSKCSRRDALKWIASASLTPFARAQKSPASKAADGERPNAQFAPVRNRIQKAMLQGRTVGLAVAVVQDGRIVWEEGFGWADREAAIKATPRTPLGMASITKPFTTTTLMTLVAEGKLALDAAANRYLPGSRLIGTNGNAEAVTVRKLGAHNSGLPGMYESFVADESSLVPTPEMLLHAYGRIAYPPATTYEYSNIGYAALNAIASQLTQVEFGSLMQRKVLAPLGLHDTFFMSDKARLPLGAVRYDSLGRPIPHYETSTPASGELYASVHDLANFLLFNLRKRVPGQASILSQQELDELHRPVFRGPSGVATTFGWFTGQTTSGVPFFFKSGGDPGVATRMCFVPSRGVACAVATNQSIGEDLVYSICDEIMASYLPEWRRPTEYCGYPSTPFQMTAAFEGKWRGFLRNGGADMPIQLQSDSTPNFALTIGNGGATMLSDVRAEGPAMTGNTAGHIASPDAIRTGAKALQLKLIPVGNRLVGRLFAIEGDPTLRNTRLPYVLTFGRG